MTTQMNKHTNVISVRSLICITLFSFLAILLGGCKKPDSSAEGAPSKVSLRLQWFDLAQFAGFYLAKDQGFYEAKGLDVTINPGGPDLNAITLVASRSDTFGVWTADHILMAQSKGVPIVILAAIYRDDPNILMVRSDSEIKGPKDFVGKTVTTVFGRSTETVLKALLSKENVDQAQVNIIPFPFNIQSFLEGKVDVSAGYVYDHPFQAEKNGMSIRLIEPSKYGIKFYSDCIFARKDFVEKNPEIVRAFIRASIEGWKSALKDKNAAIAATLLRVPSLDALSQMYLLEKAEPLILSEDPENIGVVNPASLEAMANELKRQNLLPQDFSINGTFTNQFLKK
jgi:NitT/TauT family transport system substrate-binding protein